MSDDRRPDERAEDRARRFTSERPRLLGLAYRMLGSRTDAEDVVQEAWLRYAAAGAEPDNPEPAHPPDDVITQCPAGCGHLGIHRFSWYLQVLERELPNPGSSGSLRHREGLLLMTGEDRLDPKPCNDAARAQREKRLLRRCEPFGLGLNGAA